MEMSEHNVIVLRDEEHQGTCMENGQCRSTRANPMERTYHQVRGCSG